MTAAAAQLKILNLALAHLGEPSVDTLDLDQTTEAARKLLPFLDVGRDQVLAGHGWRAAMTYATLPDSGEAGNWKYAYVLHLPGDALRVCMVGDCWLTSSSCWPLGGAWERTTREKDGEERAVILSNAPSLNIGYVRRIGWDGIPVELYTAMAAWVAALGAEAVAGNAEKGQRLMKMAGDLVAKAASVLGVQAGGQEALVTGTFSSLRRAC